MRVPTSAEGRVLPIADGRAAGARNGGSLKCQPPALVGNEVLVMDCHSHGRHPAYFSSTDNDDDRHDAKMALVIGNRHRATPGIAVRLCAKGALEETERAPASWYGASIGGSLNSTPFI
ncbi:Mov34/MPN/PAD-1 family protein [Paraburkholderia sprentiae]|uniref:Mov34/MPN/PAD-1 family protein n=1 Tax=Paraburkholderia sprentiae TaxID=948107 RepID=UPI00389A6532